MARPKKKIEEPEVKPVKSKGKATEEFPHSGFPVKVVHKDGKEMKDKKTCYFQSKEHAQKYIARCKFKKKDYVMTCRDETP